MPDRVKFRLRRLIIEVTFPLRLCKEAKQYLKAKPSTPTLHESGGLAIIFQASQEIRQTIHNTFVIASQSLAQVRHI